MSRVNVLKTALFGVLLHTGFESLGAGNEGVQMHGSRKVQRDWENAV